MNSHGAPPRGAAITRVSGAGYLDMPLIDAPLCQDAAHASLIFFEITPRC